VLLASDEAVGIEPAHDGDTTLHLPAESVAIVRSGVR
jgi:hypothetical protein